jgi:glycine cleavage system regulatory protein
MVGIVRLLARSLHAKNAHHKNRGKKNHRPENPESTPFAVGIGGKLWLSGSMQSYLIMTVLGADRPGLVSRLSEVVTRHGGNWLESRMARLAGQFAGVIRIEIPSDAVDELLLELQGPGASGLTVSAVREVAGPAVARRTISIEVVGADRPGIVRELSAAIARVQANIEELTTGLESAPMSGQLLFRAKGLVSIPEEVELAALHAAFESLGGDLTLDVTE